MKISEIKKIIKKIEANKKAVGKRRDELREIISDAESFEADCEDAYNNLQDAVARLSELV